MSSFFKRLKKKQNSIHHDAAKEKKAISTSLSANLELVKQRTGNSSDISIRTLKIGEVSPKCLAIIFIEGMVDTKAINEKIVESIMRKSFADHDSSQHLIQSLTDEGIAIGSIKTVNTQEDLFLALMDGNTIILLDGTDQAIIANTAGGETRSIQEPESQVSVRGPRDGFTESIQTNISLVRRRIRNPDLWVESMKIGKKTKTNVAIMYLNGNANEKIVAEVRQRLKKIDIESILESGYIEQLIEDQAFTTFPTLYHTERPDAVAGNILEGRIAIFVDGTPFVLLAPAVFIQFFQSVEDYYTRFDIITALRFLRILTFFISIVAPSVYIASTTFHQEMIPTQLVIIIAAQRENVPFPAFVEALIMEITFEILREAGIRMPRAVGSAISIVGALVIGQAAVQAGIVSPAMVIIVSITAIANFATPSFTMAISARLIRFLFMFSAAVFGLYGVILGMLLLAVHLCALRSFGVPYMTPLAPISPDNVGGDTLVRAPLWKTREKANLIMKQGENLYSEDMDKPKPPLSRGIITQKKKKGDTDEN